MASTLYKAVCRNEYNEGIFAKSSGGNSSTNFVYWSKSGKSSRTGLCACSPKKKKIMGMGVR